MPPVVAAPVSFRCSLRLWSSWRARRRLRILRSGSPTKSLPRVGGRRLKFQPQRPALIAGGYVGMTFDPSVFGPIGNVAVFSAAGDAMGIATVNGQTLSVLFNAPSAGIGQVPDLPLLTVTIPVLPTAATGTISAITLSPSSSAPEFPTNLWTDENRNPYTVSVTPGSVTVGGTLSIQNVVPGGGLLAAGTLVRVNGTGFSAATSVSVAGVSVSNTQFIGPGEIDVTLGGAADLTGKQMVVANRDGSQTRFFSAVKSIPDEAPAIVAQAGLEPLLSMQPWVSAGTNFNLRGGAIALQNPNPVPVDVVLQTQYLTQTTVTIPPGDLQIYETSGVNFNAFATLPIRVMGLEFAGFEGILPEAAVPALPLLQQVTAEPAAVSFSWQIGTAIPVPVSVNLLVEPSPISSKFTVAVTSSGPPFSVTSVPATMPGTLTVAVNPAGLGPGSYTGVITITPEGPNAVVTTIPLSLTVSPQALLYSSAASLTITSPGGSQGFLSITSNGNPIPFTVTATSGPGPAWLSVSPSSATTPANLTVNEASTGLSDGVYNGQVSISGPNNTETVPVQWTVTHPSLFSSAPTSVTFSIQAGSAAPPAQTVYVYGSSTDVTFSASTSSGGTWMSVTKTASGALGAVITANPAGLAAGIYSGTVSASSPTSAVPASIPVFLVIWNQQPALIVTPASVSFTSPVPEQTAQAPMQILQINSAVPVNFTTTVSTGMFITPASIPVYGQFPFNLQGAANLGSYEYNISVTSGTQTVIVPVTTFITTGPATPPFLGSIVNAASQTPSAVAPGEILTIYGFGAGPSNTAGFTLDASGNVATSLNGAQVLFDGRPAPMIYGSAYMANVIVPYEIANQATTTIELQYGGVTSAGWSVPVAASAPGIFTLGAAGLGQGAVLNQDNSVNGASNPAARGSVIQIYATGEGQTSPPGVTGSVIGTDLKRPILPVTVSIGGQDAVVQYKGSAGDSVAGLLQVNAIVPQSVIPGAAVPVIVSVGGVPSQGGVTVAVQ